MAPLTQKNELDPLIWNACAGLSVLNHSIDSRVYYFPQGHAEHSSSPPDLSSLIHLNPMVLCRVVSVRLLANPETDEVFSKIGLEPIDPSLPRMMRTFPDSSLDGGDGTESGEKKVSSFAKILTPSDANNGGGFSVPRYCADSIFPPLNYDDEPPVQNISVRDVHGVVWEFRHIFRGTPRRHLLTTGWSKFVNHKKLVAGDSVVFINRRGELFVGIRRAARSIGTMECGRYNGQIAGEMKLDGEFGNGEGFSRASKGRVSAESVLKAAELAGAGRPFQVVYYPNAGSPDFVVKAERVESALHMHWIPGTRFKLSMESEDSSRMTCFYGTVSSSVFANQGPFRGSPWRMLQVNWDDSEVLKTMTSVSPWLVELVEATAPLQTPFPPPKKLRGPHNSELLTDGEGAPFFPMTGFANSMMGHINLSLFDPNSFPVGMQGARQNTIGSSGFTNFLVNGNHQMYPDHLYGSAVPPLSSVSTDLNIGSASQSNNSSPHSQGSVNFVAKERLSNQSCGSVTKAGTISFQLFGTIININQSVDMEHEGVGCTADDGYKETPSLINLLDPSLPLPYKKLHSRLDVQCQRMTAMEACNL